MALSCLAGDSPQVPSELSPPQRVQELAAVADQFKCIISCLTPTPQLGSSIFWSCHRCCFAAALRSGQQVVDADIVILWHLWVFK
jgi:hypothetical protein